MKNDIFREIKKHNKLVERELRDSENGEIINLTDLMAGRERLIVELLFIK